MSHLRSDPATIADNLLEVVRHHARAALETSGTSRGEMVDVLVHAGSAVELLTKLVLFTHNEWLLWDSTPGRYQALVAAHTNLPKVRGSKLAERSVEAQASLELLARILPRDVPMAGAQLVLRHRNAAAHLGLADHRAVAESRQAMTTFVASISTATGHSQDWALPRVFAVQEALRLNQEHQDEIKALAQKLIDAAIANYARLRAKYASPPGAFETFLEVVQGTPLTSMQAEENCPACGNTARVEYDDNVEAEADHGEVLYYSWTEFVELRCPVCGLQLDAEQAASVDIDTSTTDFDEMRADLAAEEWDATMA